MSLRHLSWLRDLLLPVLLVVLRVCLLWLWAVLLQRLLLPSLAAELLPAWLLAVVLLLSFGLTRLAARSGGWWQIGRFLVAAAGLLLIIFAQWFLLYRASFGLFDGGWVAAWGADALYWEGEPPPAYLLTPFLFYLWLRGILDGGRDLKHPVFMRAFIAGCAGLVLYLLVLAATGLAGPPLLGTAVFLFFGTAMVLLAVSSAKTERVQLVGMAAPHARLSRYWLSTVLLVIGVLLGLALLFSGLVAPEMLRAALAGTADLLTALFVLLLKLISLLLYPIIWLLFTVLAPLISAIFTNERFELNPLAADTELGQLDQVAETAVSAAGDFRWLILVGFLLTVFLIFAVLVRRWQRGEAAWLVNEERESIYSADLLAAQMRGVLSGLFGGVGGKRPFSPYLSLDHEPATRRTIRQLYQQLLAASQPRQRPQTPQQYSQQLPFQQQEALQTLTEQYQQARYGETLPSAQAAAAARAAWAQLQAELAADSEE